MDDGEAIDALRRGNTEGMDTLVAAHQSRALRVAYQITRDTQAAEDVVADAFLAVFQRIKSLGPHRPFQPTFLRIILNRPTSRTPPRSPFQRGLGCLSRPKEPSDP